MIIKFLIVQQFDLVFGTFSFFIAKIQKGLILINRNATRGDLL
jgi:hypothetical protein